MKPLLIVVRVKDKKNKKYSCFVRRTNIVRVRKQQKINKSVYFCPHFFQKLLSPKLSYIHTLTTTLVTTNLCEQRYITTTTTNTKLLLVIRKKRAHSIASKWHTHTHTRKTDLLAFFKKEIILKPKFKI